MKHSLLLGPLAALAIFAGAPGARACSCALSDFYTAYDLSTAILLGEVTDITLPPPVYPVVSTDLATVTLRVETVWKDAPAASTAQVVTAMSGASCGFSFQQGKRYLVYAYRLPTGELLTSLCSRTHETWAQDPDLALLASPVPFMSLKISPNPASGRVQVTWMIPGDMGKQGHARIEVLDAQGRRVRTLVDGAPRAVSRVSLWDGRSDGGDLAPSGIYWVRFTYGDRVVGQKLVRLTAGP